MSTLDVVDYLSRGAMDQFHLGYSGKNIPLPPKNNYIKCLIEMMESVIKRMRWRAHFFLKGKDRTSQSDDEDATNVTQEKFGFKSKRTPPQIEEMTDFENDLLSIVDGLEFRKTGNKFQKKLSEDVKRINGSNKVLVHADKTRNIYLMSPREYEKLLNENSALH